VLKGLPLTKAQDKDYAITRLRQVPYSLLVYYTSNYFISSLSESQDSSTDSNSNSNSEFDNILAKKK
jgi:hypothetical protein